MLLPLGYHFFFLWERGYHLNPIKDSGKICSVNNNL